MKKILLGMTLPLLFTVAQAQTIYKVVGKDGSVTYTDSPAHGAELVKLGKINTSQPLAKPQRQRPVTTPKQAEPVAVNIVTPAANATIRDNNGNVTLQANTEPQKAGLYELVLNGKALATNGGGAFQLTGVERGEHQYQIHFKDNTGKILASSPVQTFYMHRASALINPN